jgi:SAM-dependent methyltransferase
MHGPPEHFVQHAWDLQRAARWKQFASPARPSPGEVAAYDQGLGADARDIAILGSTPELRALARRRQVDCVCIDVNRDVFGALSELVREPGTEELLAANWLDLTITEGFDAILGDGAINMLPCHYHSRLLGRLAAALRPGGRALLRVHVVGPPVYATPEDVVAAYRQRPGSDSFWTWTRTHFDMLWRDADDVIRFDDCHRRVRQLFQRGVLRNEEYAAYDRVAAVNNIALYYVRPDAFETLAAESFTIDSVTHATDYEAARHHPLYVLVKRA